MHRLHRRTSPNVIVCVNWLTGETHPCPGSRTSYLAATGLTADKVPAPQSVISKPTAWQRRCTGGRHRVERQWNALFRTTSTEESPRVSIDSQSGRRARGALGHRLDERRRAVRSFDQPFHRVQLCLLYTSDAA